MKSIKGGAWDKAGKGATKPKVVLSRPEGERKYSDMLLELIKPYLIEEPHPDDADYMVDLGIVAWNMAITTTSMGLPIPNPFIDQALAESDIDSDAKKMVYEMIEQKSKKFPAATDLIQDYEFVDNGKGMYNLTLHAQPLDNFLDNIDDGGFGFDDEDIMDEGQYEEGIVNRSALLVQPTPAFWAWLKKQNPSFEAPQAPTQATVYLIPELLTDKAFEKWLKKNFDKIFFNELEERTDDDIVWPDKRTYKLFKELFTFTNHDMVMDLEAEPVLK